MAPVGYEEAEIRWVVDVDQTSGVPTLQGRGKGELKKGVPIRGDRSGTPSEDNLKAALLVDRASYALGVTDGDSGKEESSAMVHQAFKDLLKRYANERGDAEATRILEFLNEPRVAAGSASPGASLTPESGARAAFWQRVAKEVKPGQLVAFRSDSATYPFERPAAHRFWEQLLGDSCTEGGITCAVCGLTARGMRILPWQISISGYSCPICSFNRPAFESFGKKQTANAPLCFACASRSSQVLQHLVNSETHRRLIARDDSKGTGKSPLKNQVAIFWLRERAQLQDPSDPSVTIDLEEELGRPLTALPAGAPPPPAISQLDRLLSLPWQGGRDALNISKSSFYLAILSPNKSRLVVREWMEASIESAWKNLAEYERALRIIDPEGDQRWPPPIGAILAALKPEGVESAAIDTGMLRGLLRTAYLGYSPPAALLAKAVGRFRIPDRRLDAAAGADAVRRQALRRMALVAAMKLVLTHGKGDVWIMEELSEQNGSVAYWCGSVLAILDEAQWRSAKGKLTTRLSDRCYGAAAATPGLIFGRLISRGTSAHMPKLRKEWGGIAYREIEPLLEDALRGAAKINTMP
jgi:CRISPR-associated protein Csd1